MDITENTSRFSGASWYTQARYANITVAGIGGIGSHLAFLLSRLSPASITMYDDDKVEYANLSGQLFGMDDIGMKKVDAVARMMERYSNYYLSTAVPSKFKDPSPIMMCGFDNMSSRKLFYEAWKQQDDKLLYIDGRLGAENFQIFSIVNNDERAMSLYEKEWLFSDDVVETTPCSYKQTTFMASMIASCMTNIFVNFLSPEDYREVPFFTEYDAKTMNLKITP